MKHHTPPNTRRGPSSPSTAFRLAVGVAVAVAAALPFVSALRNGFVAWDDDRNLTGNLLYRGFGGAQLEWMWTTFHMGHYVPLSWMTLGLDYTLWGMDAAGYHLTSILLHAGNAVLLYYLARRLLASLAPDDTRLLTIAAAFAALVFAVHPLRVESVVWATERRDVLSLLFALAAILAYLRAQENRPASYWLSLGLYACALLSKATTLTLPAVLLIVNVYPLRRLGGAAGFTSESARRVYREVIPFGLLAAATIPLTLVALGPVKQLALSGKVAASFFSLGFYLLKTVVPIHLSPLYEMPGSVDPLRPEVILSAVVVVSISVVAWRFRGKAPGFAAAWLAFLVVTLPMLGIVQNGPQIVADRYTYHAAPALAVVFGGVFVHARRLFPPATAIVAVILVVLGALTRAQTGVWRNTETLWSHTLRFYPESSIPNVGLATVLMKENRVEEAVDHYRRGIAADPAYADGYGDLGVALARLGRTDEAIIEYQRALAIDPRNAVVESNLATALMSRGDFLGAMQHYERALAVDPTLADAHVNWGNALVRVGRFDEAIAHYRSATAIRPLADAHLNWGVALARKGDLDGAIEHFRDALAIDPGSADAKTYLENASRLRQRRN